MPADPKSEGPAPAPAPAPKPKRYVVVRSFTGRFHTQLLSFVEGVELDAHVGEYFLHRAGGDVAVVEE